VTTNNDDLAEKIRLMQNFGFTDWDEVDHIGINGKMTEVCAAMGLANLRSIDQFREINRRNYETYASGLAEIPGLHMVRHYNDDEGSLDRRMSNKQYIPVEIMEEFPLSRNELMRRLHDESVLVRRYFWPGCHRMEPYKTLQPEAGKRLPVTESILERILLFPTGAAINPEMIRRVLALVKGWAC